MGGMSRFFRKVSLISLQNAIDSFGDFGYNIFRTTMKRVTAMLLNLAKIIDCPGAVLPFEETVDLHELQFGNIFPVSEPVRASGQIRNTAGVLLLTGNLKTALSCVCDRCTAAFIDDFDLDFEATLVTELQNEQEADEWVFLLENDGVDLEEVITTAFVLNMDSKMLCSEDCKGLCAKCGANLNDGPCGCKKEVDPRLAVLAQLLEKK